MSEQRLSLWTLFWVVLRIGAFTFGGGYAMIPLMQREYVEKRHWVEENDIVDIFAVAQSLPGVIAVNSSILIGYRIAKLPGALVAALGVTLPSLIVLAVISFFYQAFMANVWIARAFGGIRAGVVALMVQAVIKLGKPAIKDYWGWIFALVAFVLSVALQVNAILLIVGGGLVGWLVQTMRKRGARHA